MLTGKFLSLFLCNVPDISDRMSVLGRPHSTGPMYVSINDLPRRERFLQHNVICIGIMPGPKEPSLLQMNHCLEPLVNELVILQHGE